MVKGNISNFTYRVDIVGAREKPVPEDSRHPDWHPTVCNTYSDNSVLIRVIAAGPGADQLHCDPNISCHIEDAIASQQLPNSVDKSVRHAILASHVLDAEQVKLPKVRLPERPAFNLPCSYGISHERVK